MDHTTQTKAPKLPRLSTLGLASCFGLVGLVMIALLCPVSLTASAAETQANLNVATKLSVAMAPSVDIDLDPTENGGYAEGSTQLTVSTNNLTGYQIFIYAQDGSQTLKHATNPLITVGPIAGEVTAADFGTNTWGYNLNHGTTAGTSFRPIPETLSDSQTVKDVAEDDTWTLTFGAKVATSLPAGRYSSTVVIAAVANATEISSFTQLVYMQDMTHAICASSQVGDTEQLIDLRDHQKYWVTKLADGNCWMTQNLALDFKDDQGNLDNSSGNPTTYAATVLTSETSDLGWSASNGNDGSGGAYPTTPKTWSKARVTQSVVPGAAQSTQTETRSWNLGRYYEQIHDGSKNCGLVSDISQCVSQGILAAAPSAADVVALGVNGQSGVERAKHYLLGNYYQWNTATAGTGGAITSGQAADSICPRNWKLPISNSQANGSFYYLLAQYGLQANVSSGSHNIAENPLFFVRSGAINPAYSPNSSYQAAEHQGYYWSSTPSPNGTYAYYLNFYTGANTRPSNSYERYIGLSLRCLAR